MRSEQEMAEAIQRYGDMVRRLCMVHLKNYADTEDIFQTVFLKYALTSVSFDSTEHEKAWLIRVTLNESKRLLCSPWRRHTAPLADYEASLSWETPAQEDLFQAVMNLPRKYRLPLYLYYYEGYAVREIALLLRRKPSTVQTQLARGREQLQHILQEEWSYE